MSTARIIGLLLLITAPGLYQPPGNTPTNAVGEISDMAITSALLTTRFYSFEGFQKVVQVEYFKAIPGSDHLFHRKDVVRLTHISNGKKVTSVLHYGITEADFIKAQKGGFWDKLWLGIRTPYSVANRKNFLRVYTLARRRYDKFGEGDVAFYDLAETMEKNISEDDLARTNPKDLSEKGYLNSFNHITAQVFMTSLFSEKLADFLSDSHERHHIPELITGKFTEEQVKDIENGPVDNYVDIVNNEWGQELGKVLRKKHKITPYTDWTPELLTDYLNDIQAYYSWAFQIGFQPFRPTDELVIRFSSKINRAMGDMRGL